MLYNNILNDRAIMLELCNILFDNCHNDILLMIHIIKITILIDTKVVSLQ